MPGGGWAAVDRGEVCEALVRSDKIAAAGKVQATAGLAFTPDRRAGANSMRGWSRVSRPGVDGGAACRQQPFCSSCAATSRGAVGRLKEQAIVEALRGGGYMKVEARDQGGVRFIDPYVLDGAATAIDAAAARCALTRVWQNPVILPR